MALAKFRKRKPTKVQLQLAEQAKAILPESIASLKSPDEAETLEGNLWKFRMSGFLSDQEYQSHLTAIKKMYEVNNWQKPTRKE